MSGFKDFSINSLKTVKSVSVEKWIAYALFMLLLFIPMFSSMYNQLVFGKFISYMIFALALDILWGYCGLMNLGFALFFGLGGYVFGISLACQNGLPAFMEFGGLTKLPLLYLPLKNIPLAFILGLLVPSVVAFILGLFIFYSKIKGVFYNLITLALVALFELLLASKQMYTGGSSGINGMDAGLDKITFFGKPINITGWYYIGLVSLVVVYILCRLLTKARFGSVIKSVRDNEARVQFLGYNPAVFKIAIFTIAAFFAGFAGMLYLPMTSFISIDAAGVSFSTMVLVWLAVGGRGNLTGAMAGALLVSFLQSKLSESFGNMWQLVLGVVLIVIVYFLPKGIIGTLQDIQYNKRIAKVMAKKTAQNDQKEE
ncbi:MAG: hypothetical protein MJ176_10000 [Treponema sp.]|nr:hypothetical protein [Treponema sp.]